jgi:hypothetical protein
MDALFDIQSSSIDNDNCFNSTNTKELASTSSKPPKIPKYILVLWIILLLYWWFFFPR